MTKVPKDNQIIEGEAGHKYFHMMLNMADDDLNAQEYRLLGHYLRWAGHGGTHEEGIRETAKICHMGKATVEKTRDKLCTKGYLRVTKPTAEQAKKGEATRIKVIDRWSDNILRYAKPDTPPVPNQVQVEAEGCTQIDTPPVPNQVHIEEQGPEEPSKEKDSPASPGGCTPSFFRHHFFVQPLIKAIANLTEAQIKHVKRQEGDDLYWAISQVWHSAAPGFLNNVTAMMRSRSKKTEWAESNFLKEPTPEQVLEWGRAVSAYLPQTPWKIQKSFDDWLTGNQKSPKQTVPNLAVHPEYANHIKAGELPPDDLILPPGQVCANPKFDTMIKDMVAHWTNNAKPKAETS